MSSKKIPFDQFIDDFDRSVLNGDGDLRQLIGQSKCPYLKEFLTKKQLKEKPPITISSDVITISNY